MKPKATLIVLIAMVLAGSLSACESFRADIPTNAIQPTVAAEADLAKAEATPTVPVSTAISVVTAEGMVIPAQQARLAFEIGGRLVAINFEEGDTVAKGQVLAQLDDRTQQLNLTSAQDNVVSAEAELADFLAGAGAEEIIRAEADLAKAEAALAKLLAGPTPEEIAEAQVGVRIAQAELDQLLAGARPERLEAVAARVLQAEADVRLAQAQYDLVVFGNPTDAQPVAIELQKATLTYEAAKAEHDELVNGPTDEEIAIAQARLASAQATFERVSAPPSREDVLQAQANVTQAQSRLAELREGPATEKVTLAQIKVDIARTNLAQAQLELSKTQLAAPFGGMVSDVEANLGEIIQPGAPIVILGDISTWHIETKDLVEADVSRVREGQLVWINVDALPGEAFEGRVTGISPISDAESGKTSSGEPTYTVLIEITKGQTSSLRWGMTSFIQIDVGGL